MTKFALGIDPGVTTGFALWDLAAGRFEEVSSMQIAQALIRVQNMREAGTLRLVVFEDARLRTWFGAKGREALQGAGSIKRDCQVWAEWLGLLGLPYKSVSPKAKGAKLDAQTFARLAKWDGRTNEHARDAAALVIGMKA